MEAQSNNLAHELGNKILLCNSKESIYKIFEQHPGLADSFDEETISYIEKTAKSGGKHGNIVEVAKELFVEKTVTFLSSLEMESATAYIQQHIQILLGKQSYDFFQMLLKESASRPLFYQHLTIYFNLVASELSLILTQNLPFDDFIDLIGLTKSWLNDPVLPWMLERLKVHYPEKIELLDERLRIVRKLSSVGYDQTIMDLKKIQCDALRFEIGKNENNIDLPLRKRMIEKALELYVLFYPEDIPMLKLLLGEVLVNLGEGNKAENIEKAIELYEDILQTEQLNFPHATNSTALNDLGNAFLYRVIGNKEENIEKAIEFLNLAGSLFLEEENMDAHAFTIMNLGICYGERLKGIRSENLEQSIGYFNQCITFFLSKDNAQSAVAQARLNLALVYIDRIKGEKIQNVEEALSLLNYCLTFYTKDNHPDQWANCKMNLSTAYQHRLLGDKLSNLNLAKECLEAAQTIFTKANNEWAWIMSSHNLGIIYLTEAGINRRVESLVSAKIYLEQTVGSTSKYSSPYEWSMAQFNLGLVYESLGSIELSFDNINKAINCFRASLEIRTKQGQPYDWAVTQTHLCSVLYNAGRNSYTRNYPECLNGLTQAMEILTPDTAPMECLQCCLLLGRIYHETKSFQHSKKIFQIGHQCLENGRLEMTRTKGRKELSLNYAILYEKITEACVENGEIEEALFYVMSAKSRSLFESLNNEITSVQKKIESDKEFADNWSGVSKLREELNHLTMKIEFSNNIGRDEANELFKEIAELRVLLKSKLNDIFYRYPDVGATHTTPVFDITEIKMLAKKLGNVPMLEFYRHAGGFCVFVILVNDVHYRELPQLTNEKLNLISNWIAYYEEGRQDATDPLVVSNNLKNIYDACIRDVFELIQHTEKIIIAPFSTLHLFPFHAAIAADNRYLVEHFIISYIPSLITLKSLEQRTSSAGNNKSDNLRLLSVAYSAYGTGRYLPNVIKEATSITRLFLIARCLHEEQATVQDTIKLCNSGAFNVVHFGCHGAFDFEDPGNSGLLLNDGLLSVEQIQHELRLPNTTLAVMAACETGKIRPEAGDEHIGLQQAFFSTGCSGIISSLWKIDDEASQFFFEQFYASKHDGLLAATAVRDAMLILMRHPLYKEPFYWAAFQYAGILW